MVGKPRKKQRPRPLGDRIRRRHSARRCAPHIIPSGPERARIHRATCWYTHLHPNHRLTRRKHGVVVEREPDERRGSGAGQVLVPVPTPRQVGRTSCRQDADVLVVALPVTRWAVAPATEAGGPIDGRVEVDVVMRDLGVPDQ